MWIAFKKSGKLGQVVAVNVRKPHRKITGESYVKTVTLTLMDEQQKVV